MPVTGSRPISLDVHGDLLYVLNAGGDGNISGFAIGPQGTLTALPGSSRPLSGQAAWTAGFCTSSSGGARSPRLGWIGMAA